MSRKILAVHVRTIDEKNHIKSWKTSDIVIDSINFKIDEKSKPAPVKEPPKDTKKETKKTPKKDSKKE